MGAGDGGGGRGGRGEVGGRERGRGASGVRRRVRGWRARPGRRRGGLGSRGVGGHDFEDAEPGSEGVADLVLVDAPRAGAGLVLVEAEDVVDAAGAEDGRDARREAGPVVVGEDVEAATVDDGVEEAAQPGEIQGVGLDEAGAEGAGFGFCAGGDDGVEHEVDAPDFVAAGGEVEGVLAGAASDVEDARADAAVGLEGDEGGLGVADVPGGGAELAVGALEVAGGRGREFGCVAHGGGTVARRAAGGGSENSDGGRSRAARWRGRGARRTRLTGPAACL